MPNDKAPDYTTKTTRPWGHFRLLDQGPGFIVKAMLVKGEQRLSLQRHTHREERWTVAMGNAVATVSGVKHALAAGDSVVIPRGAAHRLANPAKEPLMVVEVWLGNDLREDDIERLEDDYGRVEFAKGGVISGPPKDIKIGNGEKEHVVPLKETKHIEKHPGGRNWE
ncbi:MAG: phosphomannose isomerase type II C-terminal cupin domain [Sphingomonadales bacterium]|nr:phosphomannose isomerase type II C-terminal cupin domain [Sphingomonadaceae bacterium]MBS3930414.1 phosphomannose isomerase type II C-terminal cupin domain [Sphingomonadales bacterium]